MLKMVDNILKIFILFLLLIFLTIFNFSDINISIENTQYLTQYTYYYPSDSTESGECTGSGKCIDSFTTDENGWYYYETDGEKYLVVAAALNICKNSTNHCGINVNKHGIAQNIKYYDYFDTLNLSINGKTYKAMVLDACGACMWKRQDDRGQELFDIYVKGPEATVPNSNDDKSVYIGNDNTSLEHFGTYYEGNIKQGWIYQRFEFKEVYEKNINEYKIESNINDVIDEIFNRAKTSFVSSYNSSIINGPGLSSADVAGFRKRVGMPVIGGEGSEYYFSNLNLSYAGGYLGQCTWYAFGRANEILNNAGSNLKWRIASNAGLWYDQNLNNGASGFKSSNDYTKPKVGAIISWKKAGAPGHVAVVEEVNGNTVTISEANIGSIKSSENPYGWQTTTLSLSEVNRRWGSYTFSGYIYMLD